MNWRLKKSITTDMMNILGGQLNNWKVIEKNRAVLEDERQKEDGDVE